MPVPHTQILVHLDGLEVARNTVPLGDYVIGCSDDADIVVECEGVSPRHALLTVNYSEWLIESLDYQSALFVNGRPVGECVRLWPNQKIQIGVAVIEVHRVRELDDGDSSLAPQAATVRSALPEEFLRERRYEIGGLVAEGGMGAILKAHEAVTGRTVAMKVVLSNPQPSTLMRFIKEAQITSQLEHPNIVPLHELGVDEHEQVFYTMKMVEGITLKQVLEKIAHGSSADRAKYSLNQLLTIFQKVCDAIAFAHSRGVVHRDLKPDNIMVGEYGEVLTMDWGLAKVLTESTEQASNDPENLAGRDASDSTFAGTGTMTGSVVGTPQYMPPEQARGEVDAHDERSDIYSLGAILYQILALRPPVSGETTDEILEKVCAGNIEPLRSSKIGRQWPIPESLSAVTMKALSPDPADRYRTVQELQADITAYQRGFATAAERAGLLKQLILLVGRHKQEAAILAAGIVGLIGIAGFALVHVAQERSAATRARRLSESERVRAEDARAQAVEERRRAEAERNRANAALATLQKAAPAFQGEASTLVEEQKFEEALEKNTTAIQLAPDNADYHLFRAHTFAAMQRLPEAVESYRRVLELRPGDSGAKSNMDLCAGIVAVTGGNALDRTQQSQLLEAILAQKRVPHSVLLAKALGREREVAVAFIQIRLKSLVQQERWNDNRLKDRADGMFALDLTDLVVPDLSLLRGLPIGSLKLGRGTVTHLGPLAGVPLRELDCSGNSVGDLSPLRGLPLERLNISESKIRDLSPLAGMPLRHLVMNFTEVTDLRPLRGLPLQTLSIAGLPIRSIEPLRGLRLRELDLFACRQFTDITSLATLAALETLNLPGHVNDLAFVPQLRSLRRLGNSHVVTDGSAFHELPTVAQFLADQGQRLAREKQFGPRLEALRNLLRKFGAAESMIADVGLDERGFMKLDISGVPFADLTALAGLPIRNLVIKGTGASNLAPLAGLPLVSLVASGNPISNVASLASCHELRFLDLRETSVADIRPLGRLKLQRLLLGRCPVQDVTTLRGMPLVELDLSECPNVSDLTPLTGCKQLETLLVPKGGGDQKLLSQIPSLKRFSNKPLASFSGDWVLVPAAKSFRFTAGNLEPLRAELRKAGMAENKVAAIQFSEDGSLDLDLRQLPIQDVSFLKDLPVRSLNLDGTSVADLSGIAGAPIQKIEMRETKVTSLEPLRGAPLEYLEAYMSPISDLSPLSECKTLRSLRISGTKVSDLTPVLGLPLTALHIRNTQIADVSPVAKCVTLVTIEISADAVGLGELRALPRLQRISSRWDSTNHQVAQTAEEFWVEFNARTNDPNNPGADLDTPPAEITIDQLAALAQRANNRLRFGRLKEAAADFKRLAELDPDNYRFLTAAPLLVHSGDVAGYRNLCQRAVQLFTSSSEAEACERVAKICSLHPGSGVEPKTASELADSGLALGANNEGFLPWAQMAKGMSDYRAGRFAEAIEWLNKPLAGTRASAPLKVTAYATLSMALHRSGRSDEARTALAEAATLLGDRFAQPEGEPLGQLPGSWQDWLIGRIILTEAQAAITTTPVGKRKL